MKRLITFSILVCAFVLPFCLQSIADDTIKADIASIKADIAGIKTEIAVMKTEIKNLKENVNTEIGNLKGNVNNGFESIQRNFDRQNNIIIACIGLPLAIIAIGVTVWAVLANRRKKEFEALKQEMETLKQQLILQQP